MKNKIIAGVIGVVVLGGVFYAGTAYGKSQVSSRQPGQGLFGQGGQFQNRVGGGGGLRGGATAGEVLSKDATSITIKMQDGSTKIVLTSPSLSVMKTVAGTLGDIVIGTNVLVMGTTNTDGSITGQSVQIRPADPVPFGRQAPVSQ
jgi:hypothetical protein